MSTFGSITEWWPFYYLLCLVGGFIGGLGFAAMIRRISQSRDAALIDLGLQMQSLEHDIFYNDSRRWPAPGFAHGPRLVSLVIKSRKCGLWAPGDKIMDLNDDGALLRAYLGIIGRFLTDGLIDEARTEAENMRVRYEHAVARLPQSSRPNQ